VARNIEAEDTGVAVMKFRSGALGSLQVTMLTYPKNLEGSITILGEKGSVKIGGTAVNKVEHWEFAEWDDDDKLVEQSNTAPPSVYGYGHVGYYRNVVSTLRGVTRPETDGRGGRKSLELSSRSTSRPGPGPRSRSRSRRSGAGGGRGPGACRGRAGARGCAWVCPFGDSGKLRLVRRGTGPIFR